MSDLLLAHVARINTLTNLVCEFRHNCELDFESVSVKDILQHKGADTFTIDW